MANRSTLLRDLLFFIKNDLANNITDPLNRVVVDSEELYENYQNGSSNSNVYGTNYKGQTFTVGNVGANETFNITKASFKMYKVGSPGFIDMELYSVDSNGVPSGIALSTGSFDGALLDTATGGSLYNITMGSYTLQELTQYAIYLKALVGDASNYINIKRDSAGTYTGGSLIYTSDGVNWDNIATTDAQFRVYGQHSTNVGFLMTSYPQREVKYPVITIKCPNLEATRSGMQTDNLDIVLELEVRIWARNEKEKDTIYQQVMDRLATIQFSASGSVNNDFHDFQILSSNEVDEDGDMGVKSRILQVQYKFYDA